MRGAKGRGARHSEEQGRSRKKAERRPKGPEAGVFSGREGADEARGRGKSPPRGGGQSGGGELRVQSSWRPGGGTNEGPKRGLGKVRGGAGGGRGAGFRPGSEGVDEAAEALEGVAEGAAGAGDVPAQVAVALSTVEFAAVEAQSGGVEQAIGEGGRAVSSVGAG